MGGRDGSARGRFRCGGPAIRRKWLWALFAVAAILLVAAAAAIAPLLFERNAYAHVASVERRSDYRDARLLARAWALPVARLYSRRPYKFQDNQSFCGPASLANVLHSMGQNVSQHEAIDGSEYEPWFGILLGGMTLDELAALTRERSGGAVSIIRRPALAEFRGHLASANHPARRYIVNFHRGPLFGRGHGHFSPILGYLADRDLVLVGDVNADYRPFLVSSERLWRAANTVDDATGFARGLIRIDVTRAGARASPAPIPSAP